MLKVVHVSYAVVNQYNDPEQWLKRINFFTGFLDHLALQCEVTSIHCIACNSMITKNQVHYHFLHVSKLEQWFSLRVNFLLKKLQPDVIVIHGLIFPLNVLWLRLLLGRKTKVFIQHHAERPLSGAKRPVQIFADRIVKGYFFTSLALAQPWLDAGLISNRKKIHEVMEVSSALTVRDQHEARTYLKINDDLIYLWVGRLDNNKDPVTVLRAFVEFTKSYPSARLYMIYQTEELLQAVKQITMLAPDNIVLVGKVDHDKLEYWYSAADFIISGSHYEGSGVAVCEAMSCGCIPILTDIPSFRWMTDNGTCGMLYTPGNTTALCGLLLKSIRVDRVEGRERTLMVFNKRLSFKAIAQTIYSVISSG